MKIIENSMKINRIDEEQQCSRRFIVGYATFIGFYVVFDEKSMKMKLKLKKMHEISMKING